MGESMPLHYLYLRTSIPSGALEQDLEVVLHTKANGQAVIFREILQREKQWLVRRYPVVFYTFQPRVMHKDPAGPEVRTQERELAPWPVKHLNFLTREAPALPQSSQQPNHIAELWLLPSLATQSWLTQVPSPLLSRRWSLSLTNDQDFHHKHKFRVCLNHFP